MQLQELVQLATETYADGGLLVALPWNDWVRAETAMRDLLASPNYRADRRMLCVDPRLVDGLSNFLCAYMVVVPKPPTVH